MKTYTATILFTAEDPFEALVAFSMMRETFCNNPPIKELACSLIDQNFHQWQMVKNGVEQPCNPTEVNQCIKTLDNVLGKQ